ncbi:HAD family hydrolase [Micromonospora halophytica]|uniref:Phosphoglycolate phosphatase, HAD superfamily n=1 Tax=Micromonospora halophytica TaxID=47864 RepID=A0A1C5ILJ7_9ACTN|nr:HAD family hydrolase [Micromonospora halophytica]SCG59220.1 Phosphoglycolate phosphatase, HAD superfamily [Micromonospora halophytica]
MTAPGFVLFDLDGTLIRPGARIQRRHMSAMAAAIADVCGTAEEFRYAGGQLWYADIDLAGFTDAGTVCAALRHHGIGAARVRHLTRQVMAALDARLGQDPEQIGNQAGDLLPGCRALLEALRGHGCPLGMSTGNARSVARWKMRRTGLADLLYDGGFGDTARDRDDVVAAGVAALGAPGNGVVIGDTAKDVTAAHAAGLRCLAVTTGATSPEDLHAAGADSVVTDLTGGRALDAVLRLLANPTGFPRPRKVCHL